MLITYNNVLYGVLSYNYALNAVLVEDVVTKQSLFINYEYLRGLLWKLTILLKLKNTNTLSILYTKIMILIVLDWIEKGIQSIN
jgi:hypothetical protein